MRDILKTFSRVLILFVFFPCNLLVHAQVSLLYEKKISDDPLRGRSFAGTSDLVIGDLFPQHGLSIVSKDNQFIFVLDGATGETLWSYEIGYAIGDLIIDDIDQDGNPEIIMGNSEGLLFVLNPYKKSLKKALTVGYEVMGIIVSDVNNDGIKDFGVLGRERGISERFSLESFAPLWEKSTEVESGTGGGKSAFTKSATRREWDNITHTAITPLPGRNYGGRILARECFSALDSKNRQKEFAFWKKVSSIVQKL